ncbi:unnamed protein product [Rhodiola kirilowii]
MVNTRKASKSVVKSSPEPKKVTDEPHLSDSSSQKIPPIPALYYTNSYFLVLFCISGDLEVLRGIVLKSWLSELKTSQGVEDRPIYT